MYLPRCLQFGRIFSIRLLTTTASPSRLSLLGTDSHVTPLARLRKPDNFVENSTTFFDLGLPRSMVERLMALNIIAPSAIQSRAIPIIRNKEQTVVIGAETGSGKTFTYLLPLCESLMDRGHPNKKAAFPSAIVFTLNAHLCQQVAASATLLLRGSHASVHVLGSCDEPFPQPGGPYLLVCCPETLLKKVYGKKDLEAGMVRTCRHIVVDEADMLLDRHRHGGRLEQVTSILAAFNRFHKDQMHLSVSPDFRVPFPQMLFAAATISRQKVALLLGKPFAAKSNKEQNRAVLLKHFKDAKWVLAPLFHKRPASLSESWTKYGSRHERDQGLLRALYLLRLGVESMDTEARALFNVAGFGLGAETIGKKSSPNVGPDRGSGAANQARGSEAALAQLFWRWGKDKPFNSQARTLIFCNRIEACVYVATFLLYYGVPCVAVHEQTALPNRLEALAAFRAEKGALRVLVTTDLLSRGTDLSVDHVIQFDFARTPVSYLHRVGRTARAGKPGHVTNFYSVRDFALVHALTQTDSPTGGGDAQAEPTVAMKVKKQSKSASVGTGDTRSKAPAGVHDDIRKVF
jgi:superfamily II DNA/RNA helicase